MLNLLDSVYNVTLFYCASGKRRQNRTINPIHQERERERETVHNFINRLPFNHKNSLFSIV